MKTVQATEAKNNFGKLLDDSMTGPVMIQKNGRDAAVILSIEDFRRLSQKDGVATEVRTSLERSMGRWNELYKALAR